jgi:sugar/nucleoside kinase (ribokinase family)
MDTRYDIYGVGNAIVDTEVQVADSFLTSHDLRKGVMALVTPKEQERLRASLTAHKQIDAAGGSAANTLVGMALLGGTAFYSGKIGDDLPGALYRRSMAEAGVEFDVKDAHGPTGTCLVLVTADGERTMQTSLGSSSMLLPSDIHPDRIAQSRMLYVEGYLWATPSTASAVEHAMELAGLNNVPVAISLSDPAIVQAFGDALRRVTRELAEVVFCNEREAKTYTGTNDRMEAVRGLSQDCPLVFMTCGSDGSMVSDHGHITAIDGHQVPMIDTTGAGDMYAAGALYGLTHQMPPDQAGKLASFVSARMVTVRGPRLNESLADRIPAILAGAHPMD